MPGSKVLFSSSHRKNVSWSINPRYLLCCYSVVQLSWEVPFVLFEWLVYELPAVDQRVSSSVFQRSPIIIVVDSSISMPDMIADFCLVLVMATRTTLNSWTGAFWAEWVTLTREASPCQLSPTCPPYSPSSSPASSWPHLSSTLQPTPSPSAAVPKTSWA